MTPFTLLAMRLSASSICVRHKGFHVADVGVVAGFTFETVEEVVGVYESVVDVDRLVHGYR